VTAAALLRSAPMSGPRPIDPRRDLAGLGSLIESAFAERLDDSGKRMVRAMRSFGRWGWLGWAAGRLFLPPAAYPEGYVWQEDGRIVGNASLMRVAEAPHRWVLINVAVGPAWRRRGIATSLVRACLDQARRRGAGEVLLQVDAFSTGAQDLYRGLGFRHLSVRGTWSRRASLEPPAPDGMDFARRRKPEDIPELLALVRRHHPEGLLWPRPLDEAVFRHPLGLGWTGHWVWPRSGPLRACLSAFPGYDAPGVHLVMVLDPEARGRAEGSLLDEALLAMLPRGDKVRLEVAEAADESVLRRYGFQLERRLAWMALTLAEGTETPGRQGMTGSVPH
jgi:ribosomal protein S18 acetylase RimI-like enzyme